MTTALAVGALVAGSALWRVAGLARARVRLRRLGAAPRPRGLAAVAAVRHRLERVGAARRDADGLAEVVDVLAASLRAGAPPAAALRSAGLDGPAASVARGLPLAAAVDAWARSGAPAGAGLVATAVAVTARAGGDPGRALARVADTLREQRALRREVRALSSQARTSAAVIAVAPVAFGVVATASDGSTARVLLGSPLGLACLAVGLTLDAAGWWWMDRITRTVVT